MSMQRTIVNNILNYCRERDLTIMAFEQKCKIANGSVGKWERGRNDPSVQSLAKIVQATHIPLEEWVRENEERAMTVGEAIKAKRKERGLTQAKLAEMIGVNIQTIRSYESDKYYPSTKKWMRLQRLLDIPQSGMERPCGYSNRKALFDDMLQDFFPGTMRVDGEDGSYLAVEYWGRTVMLNDEDLEKVYAMVKKLTEGVLEFV